MENKKIRRVVVLNKDKKLVGVVSLGDIVRKQSKNDISSELIKAVSED